MDDKRFDDLAKIVGTSVTRQSVFQALAGFGAAGLSALTGLDFAEAKHRKGHKHHHKHKHKHKHKHNKSGGTEKLCPGHQDKVCHCPPGNTDNCETTGDGAGHAHHRPLDCCCTINGNPNPLCECPTHEPDGSTCCKPDKTACANDSQCCDGECTTVNHDCSIVSGDVAGICCPAGQVCFKNACCVPETCADFPGKCGPQDDGCGGQTAACTCQSGSCCDGACVAGNQCCVGDDCAAELCQEAACDDGACEYTPVKDGQQGPLCTTGGNFCCNGDECCVAGDVCTGQGCCTPLTCADFPDQCGVFADGCGGETADCTCPSGGCCDGVCVDGAQCCQDSDCARRLCQNATCNDGTCDYTPVGNGQQGPLCTGQGQSCCNGDACCASGQVCFQNACCAPLTCAADYPGQCGALPQGCGLPDLQCSCESVACCDGICCASGQVCAADECCTPKTCADFPGQCGPQDDGCGGQTASCTCQSGTCCVDVCITADQCCVADDCPQELCQVPACVEHECDYTPVSNNEPGPLCDAQGEFCCNGDECCEAGQICTANGCCTPKTCADYPGQCGALPQGCGLPDLNCSCQNGTCCVDVCISGEQCCADEDCPSQTCQIADCVGHACDYTPVDDGDQGPLCTGQGQFCCNGADCCAAGQVCFLSSCCTPETFEEACAAAGRVCGPVSNGCGGQYDCGVCPIDEDCSAGVCLPAGGKRCQGHGLAGQPCRKKKCKCTGGRRCHKGKCCEPIGDGSRHCNADSDCCPGLTCVRRYPGQHKVCVRKPVNAQSVATPPPSPALAAIVTGSIVRGVSRLFAGSSPHAVIALDDMGHGDGHQEI
jgi:hypothetical protein